MSCMAGLSLWKCVHTAVTFMLRCQVGSEYPPDWFLLDWRAALHAPHILRMHLQRIKIVCLLRA